MHPSISLSLEPGLDRGVPWGRDLYTFVTSAAGHMMRTLQKPRKNRPSKRQVNHRRFLHNMIQRKFADIEASNHRLAAVLCFKGDEKMPETPDPNLNSTQNNQVGEKNGVAGEDQQKTKTCITVDSQNPETGKKTQPEPTRKPRPKSRKSKHQKSAQKSLEVTSVEMIPAETMHFYGEEIMTDALFTQEPNNLLQLDMDASPFSPELSPLSLDSCDFAVQMFTDISSCTPAHGDSVEEIVESQWAEIIDLFHAGNGNRRSSADVEEYLESICNCGSDTDCAKDDEQEDVFFERAQCRYESNQGEAAPHVEENTRLLHNCASSSSVNFHCMSSYEQQQQSQSTGQYELNPVPFEGVAQSFSAPSQSVQRFSIPTPPHEGDWLFTDILTDNAMSMY